MIVTNQFKSNLHLADQIQFTFLPGNIFQIEISINGTNSIYEDSTNQEGESFLIRPNYNDDNLVILNKLISKGDELIFRYRKTFSSPLFEVGLGKVELVCMIIQNGITLATSYVLLTEITGGN